MAPFAMERRDPYDDMYWWDTSTGYTVKWCIFVGLLVVLLIYFIGGYLHAKSRIKKGQMPLGYHRWLVPRRMLATVDPRYAYPQAIHVTYGYQQQPNGGYPMYSMPPPVYDPSRPPVYEEPPNISKVDPAQGRTDYARPPNGEGMSGQQYAPPPGPPPMR